MDPLTAGATSFLTAWGPAGAIILFLGWAYWKERDARIEASKDAAATIAALNVKIADILEKHLVQTREAIPILSAALDVMRTTGENARRLSDTILDRDVGPRKPR